jgi:hypothetical protein
MDAAVMSQTKPSSLGPAKTWPNKRLRLAFPIEGHATFMPSGDSEEVAPLMMVVTTAAISEERAAALRKGAEVEKPKYRKQVFENDEYRTLSITLLGVFYSLRVFLLP